MFKDLELKDAGIWAGVGMTFETHTEWKLLNSAVLFFPHMTWLVYLLVGNDTLRIHTVLGVLLLTELAFFYQKTTVMSVPKKANVSFLKDYPTLFLL